MKSTEGSQRSLPWTGKTVNFKIFLLVLASVFVVGMLIYSNQVTDRLLAKEREVVDLYARSYEYIAKDNSTSGDYSFLFDEIIQTIDFPIILADARDNPIYSRNIEIDTVRLSPIARTEFLKKIMIEMDEHNKPIRIGLNESITLNYVHYGESRLIVQLRWLPVIEIALAGFFILIAYVGFSYIKRNEQSSIWVGMSRETAHQLGTPLSSLMGWLELMKKDVGENITLQETLDEMGNDVHRLTKVAARFSKIGSRPELKNEDVREVIQDVVAYIYRRIPKTGRDVEVAITTPGSFHAQMNRELFEWVVENLLKNALDAIQGPTAKIMFAIHQTDRKTMIDVSDTGKGIEQKLHKEVFRPGFSTKKRGWGLGLSLSKRIIEEYHQGKLFVKESAVGSGTTFRIVLKR